MSQFFFITGLVRSRTGWMANLLTGPDSFCYHCLSRRYDSITEMCDQMSCLHDEYESIGNSEPCLDWDMFEEINRCFPEARWLVIQRGMTDAYVAESVAFPSLAKLMTETDLMKAQHVISRIMTATRGRSLAIPFHKLDDMEACRGAVKHLIPGHHFSERRWDLLNKLRVEVIADKALAEWSEAKRSRIMEATCAA